MPLFWRLWMLTDRQKNILSLVVTEYIHSVIPVSSQMIAQSSSLGVSPATIRNELGVLEDKGYITHPHTSAGRLPTDLGYRYFVDHLMRRGRVSQDMAGQVMDSFRVKAQSIDDVIQNSSKILSSLTNQASLVFYPKLESQYFKSVNLVPIDDVRMLVVWVSASGMVWQGFLEIEESLEAEELKTICNFINQELKGVLFSNLEIELLSQLGSRKDSLYRLSDVACRIVQESMVVLQELKFSLEGSANVLSNPEFDDLNKTRTIIDFFEDKISLLQLFDRDITTEQGLKVQIGHETQLNSILDCSLITSSYKLKDQSVGFLGVLGPKRMDYGNIISVVEYMSDEMQSLLKQTF